MERSRTDGLHVVGIDLSGRTTGRTALALLTGRSVGRPVVRPLDDHDGGPLGPRPDVRLITRLCADLAVDLVAIDAPLELPHAVTCTDPDCVHCFPPAGGDASYGSRSADRSAAWREVGHTEAAPMATAMLAGIAFRGIYLRRALRREGIAALETWPKGVYRALASRDGVTDPPPPSSDADRYVAWAAGLLLGRIEADRRTPGSPDEVDALAAAYAGWVHLAGVDGGCVHVGGVDGAICVPTRGAGAVADGEGT